MKLGPEIFYAFIGFEVSMMSQTERERIKEEENQLTVWLDEPEPGRALIGIPLIELVEGVFPNLHYNIEDIKQDILTSCEKNNIFVESEVKLFIGTSWATKR